MARVPEAALRALSVGTRAVAPVLGLQLGFIKPFHFRPPPPCAKKKKRFNQSISTSHGKKKDLAKLELID